MFRLRSLRIGGVYWRRRGRSSESFLPFMEVGGGVGWLIGVIARGRLVSRMCR